MSNKHHRDETVEQREIRRDGEYTWVFERLTWTWITFPRLSLGKEERAGIRVRVYHDPNEEVGEYSDPHLPRTSSLVTEKRYGWNAECGPDRSIASDTHTAARKIKEDVDEHRRQRQSLTEAADEAMSLGVAQSEPPTEDCACASRECVR